MALELCETPAVAFISRDNPGCLSTTVSRIVRFIYSGTLSRSVFPLQITGFWVFLQYLLIFVGVYSILDTLSDRCILF